MLTILQKHRVGSLLLFITAFLMIGAGIGIITNAGKDTWYDALTKSTMTPPDAAFGIVWSTLYLLLAIVAWLLWQRRHDMHFRGAIRLFWGQMAVNWGWSFVFFSFHLTTLAFFWIVVLAILIALTIRALWPLSRLASTLMMPYLIWVCFASYLSFVIWSAN